MRRLTIATTVAALAFAVPASAQAAVLSIPKPCYAAGIGSLPDQPIAFGLSGGQPGFNWKVASVDFRALSTGAEPRGVFDATGNVGGAFTNYSLPGTGIDATPGRKVTFTATQGANLFGQAPIAQATTTVTNLALTIPTGRALKRRTWKVSGLLPAYGGSTYYATWLQGKKTVKKRKLGKAKGACGYLTTKQVLSPARRSGKYTLYVHSSKKLNKKKALVFPFRVFVF